MNPPEPTIASLTRELILSRAETAKVEKMFIQLSERYQALQTYVNSLRGTPIHDPKTIGTNGNEISEVSRKYFQRDRHTEDRKKDL